MTSAATYRLRKHADYQLVYKHGRKQFTKNLAYFYALRSMLAQDGVPPRSEGERHTATTGGPRIGLTVPKALGGAVVRNRIKRRMREAVRAHLDALTAPVDVVVHPRRVAATMEFRALSAEVRGVLVAIEKAARRTSPHVADKDAARGAKPGPEPGPERRTGAERVA